MQQFWHGSVKRHFRQCHNAAFLIFGQKELDLARECQNETLANIVPLISSFFMLGTWFLFDSLALPSPPISSTPIHSSSIYIIKFEAKYLQMKESSHNEMIMNKIAKITLIHNKFR